MFIPRTSSRTHCRRVIVSTFPGTMAARSGSLNRWCTQALSNATEKKNGALRKELGRRSDAVSFIFFACQINASRYIGFVSHRPNKEILLLRAQYKRSMCKFLNVFSPGLTRMAGLGDAHSSKNTPTHIRDLPLCAHRMCCCLTGPRLETIFAGCAGQFFTDPFP